MQVSVVVPTFNGIAKLAQLLPLLEKQTTKDFEAIVVVDGSTDGTEKMLAGIKTNYTLRSIVQQNKGRSGARNTGAMHARGEILVFFDDDILPDPTCIEQHVQHHRQHPGSVCIGTAQTVYPEPKSDFHRFKEHIEKMWTEALPTSTAIPKEKLFLSAANFSINKKDFERVGAFDERLKDLEDFEFATRAFEMGILFFYHPLAMAIHNDLTNCKNFVKRQRNYKHAYDQLLQLKPEVAGFYRKKSLSEAVPLKRMAFNFFSRKFFVDFIDGFNILPYLLPKKARFRFYEAVTWGLSNYFPKRKL
jgi:glycosyltransferase involved in cell wall biosynthesis